MIYNCKYNPLVDLEPVEEVPEFECNIERMLASGSIGEIANNADAYNNLDIDEIGHRIEDVFDAHNRMHEYNEMAKKFITE